MTNESSVPRLRCFLKCLPALALLSGIGHTVSAADYTAQEKANMQLVRDFYAALDSADAKGNMKEAIVGIAEKYIAPNYIQHAFGGTNGRDAFVALFQNMAGARRGGAPAGPPAGAPPQARVLALMADGDLVVRISTRDGAGLIWNLFRVENGKLTEHWDAGPMPPGAGAPPGTPPGK